MRFLPTEEQDDFTRTLRSLLGAAEVPAAVRAWAAGEHGPGLALWSRLADTGLFALAVPEAYEGMGPLPVELALGFVELGRAGVPGPAVESAAVSVLLAHLGDGALAKRFLPGLAAGTAPATLTLPGAPRTPWTRTRPPGTSPSRRRGNCASPRPGAPSPRWPPSTRPAGSGPRRTAGSSSRRARPSRPPRRRPCGGRGC